MAGDTASMYLVYHEPYWEYVMILVSFFFLLSVAEFISFKIFRAGQVGLVLIGAIYGAPITGWLSTYWQETFVDLGYIGLILTFFEAGMTVNFQMIRKHLGLSITAAMIGVIVPFGLSYAVLYCGFGYGVFEVYIIAVGMVTTSIGITFAAILKGSRDLDFAHTRVATIMASAAACDDIIGLILASIIENVGGVTKDTYKYPIWIFLEPLLASLAMTVLTPLLSRYIFGPIFRWYIEYRIARFKHIANLIAIVLVLSAFLTIAHYIDASMLYGAFLAGMFLDSLPCMHPDAPFMVLSGDEAESSKNKSPTFLQTFERYLHGVVKWMLEPLFFASMGFAIPMDVLLTADSFLKGMGFGILMVIGKLVVGGVIPLWDALFLRPFPRFGEYISKAWAPTSLLGMAMVSRGEIALITIQIGLYATTLLSQSSFCVSLWAITLNAVIGPVCVGLLLRYRGREICEDTNWGVPTDEATERRAKARLSVLTAQGLRKAGTGMESNMALIAKEEKRSVWTSRLHSRSTTPGPTPPMSRRGSRSTSRAPTFDHIASPARAYSPAGPQRKGSYSSTSKESRGRTRGRTGGQASRSSSRQPRRCYDSDVETLSRIIDEDWDQQTQQQNESTATTPAPPTRQLQMQQVQQIRQQLQNQGEPRPDSSTCSHGGSASPENRQRPSDLV